MNPSLSKQFSLLIASTLLTFAFQPYCTSGLEYLIKAFHWLSYKLTTVFTHSYYADLIRLSLSTLLLSSLIGGAANGVYWFLKRKLLPNPMLIIWVTWLLIVGRII